MVPLSSVAQQMANVFLFLFTWVTFQLRTWFFFFLIHPLSVRLRFLCMTELFYYSFLITTLQLRPTETYRVVTYNYLFCDQSKAHNDKNDKWTTIVRGWKGIIARCCISFFLIETCTLPNGSNSSGQPLYPGEVVNLAFLYVTHHGSFKVAQCLEMDVTCTPFMFSHL